MSLGKPEGLMDIRASWRGLSELAFLAACHHQRFIMASWPMHLDPMIMLHLYPFIFWFLPTQALIQGGVSRVVVGMRHPLAHIRGRSIAALRSAGVLVDVLGECLPGSSFASDQDLASAERSAIDACLRVNEALLHRAALRRPLSILK